MKWGENGIKQWMKQSKNNRYRRLAKQSKYRHNMVSEEKNRDNKTEQIFKNITE